MHQPHVPDLAAPPGWISQFARLGYVAIGLAYVFVGLLALLSLFGRTGSPQSTVDAPRQLLPAPLGAVVLGVIVLGLVVYVTWRFVQAIRDVDHRGGGALGTTRRLGLALSGAFYAFVAVAAAERLFFDLTGVPNSQKTLVDRLMSTGWGTVVVGLLGASVLVAGLFQFYGAYGAGYMNRMRDEAYGGVSGPVLTAVGRFGLGARGAVFVLIGVFLLIAAVQNDPSETRGLVGALRTLRAQPYGPYLYGLVAAGLVAFGATSLLKARYRRIAPEDEEEEEEKE